MGCFRPATPGFIATLTATILLAIVSFCVPYVKSVYFLKATISVDNYNGSITFGTLGYCLELSNGTSCSSPSVGYELDINSLVGNDSSVEIPEVAVKWITYALVLHIVALAFAAGASIFGLLAHVREMAMTCCSSFISGFGATIALIAFIFDLVLFFVAKSRINSVGSAEIGNAIWLTLASWVLLFFSGCFYALGRCCISNRKPRNNWNNNKDSEAPPQTNYAEQMRLDAVKAEADRKALQQRGEVGLPAFYETQPLTARIEGDSVYTDNYHDASTPNLSSPGNSPPTAGGYTRGGYVQAAPGTAAVDEYYNPSQPQGSTYPPQPRRQTSATTYASNYNAAPVPSKTPPVPTNQYLATSSAYQGTSSPYDEYGHIAAGTSYHSAATHQQYPTNYSHYDAGYVDPNPPMPQQDMSYDPYSASSPVHQQGAYANPTSYYTPHQASPQPQHDRAYTLGGDGYGTNSVPPLPESPHIASSATAMIYPGDPHSVAPARAMSPEQAYEDSPPGYDAGPAVSAPGGWDRKR